MTSVVGRASRSPLVSADPFSKPLDGVSAMRFRAGDDLLALIRASVLRRPHSKGERRQPEPLQAAQITYYGRLGEMSHEDDRATDWPEADARGERS